MMLGNLFENLRSFQDRTGDRTGSAGRSRTLARSLAIGGACLLALSLAGQAQAAPAACEALQAKYPAWKGKTLVNAINPHTPGYEAVDPKDPTNMSASTSISASRSANASASS